MNLSTTTIENEGGRQDLTQRAALLMTANVIATLLSLALPLLLVRLMNQTEYGVYKQAFQIMQTALNLLNLQVAVSVFYFTAREPGKKLQVALNVVLFYSLIGAFVFLIFLTYPNWVTLIFHGSELVPHVPLLGFTILCWLVSTNLDAVPVAEGDVLVASLLIVVSHLSKAVVMIIAGLMFASLHAILVAAVIQGLMQIAFMAAYVRRKFGRLLAPIDWPLFKAQVGNALPFGLGGIAAIVQFDMHNYFVSHYFQPATFAVYAIGCFQLPLLAMLAGSFASVINPDLAKHKEARDHRAIISLWLKVIRKLAFLFVPAFVLLLVLRREFIVTLFTATYLEAAPIFAVNLISILLGLFVHLHILRLFDQLRFFRLKLCLMLIPVTWGALYLGLRAGGLVGVAVAATSVQTLEVSITLSRVARELGMSWSDLRRLTPLLRIAVAAASAALAVMVARSTLPQTRAQFTFVAGAALFSFVYVMTSFAVGAVSEDEKAGLRTLWMRFCRPAAARIPGVVGD